MKIFMLTTLLTMIGFGCYAVEVTGSWQMQARPDDITASTAESSPLSNQQTITAQEIEQNIAPIIDGYSFDKSSLIHHSKTSEDVLRNRGGLIFYETITHPEFWTFDILRGKRRIPCKIYCTDETWPKLEAEQNMPMGVLRYLRSNICEMKNAAE